MSDSDSTAVSPGVPGESPPDRRRVTTSASKPGLFQQYKPEQGKTVRVGTFVSVLTLVAWGVKFFYDRFSVYEGDEAWRLLVTIGIPIAFGVIATTVLWWVVFAKPSIGDFMIATEGEMKKVSWSTKREIIGSTKVVILFTVALALFLFAVDFLFHVIFSAAGVLKI